jgi:heptosyltransferase I
MKLPLESPPQTLCLLRLSAVGDISHTLPIVRTIQAHWPETKLTWIIGKLEHTLVGDIPGIEFIIFDKAKRWRAFRELKGELNGRHFDLLLHMQMSLRASLISTLVNAEIKLGFDRQRARDMQWLFTNRKIAPKQRQHVIDSLFGFSEALGINERVLRWDIPIPDAAHQYAEQQLGYGKSTLVISPCSSMAYRNWSVEGYAAVADYAVDNYGMQVVLTGGPSKTELGYGEAITRLMRHAPVNLIGQTDLKQLLAILQRARCVIAPDSGPAHLATAVATPVIGLYACTNPERARPYLSAEYVVNRYPEAIREKYGKLPDQLAWGVRVRDPGTMERITVEDVTKMLDRIINPAHADISH